MSDVILEKGERIDDLQYNGLVIVQNPELFRFGSDAVEIANFVTGSKRDSAVDLGSGSGIISILLAGKKGIPVTAVEIQTQVAQMSEKSVKLNNLEHLITVINAPMQEIGKYIQKGSKSIVVCNPPYAPKQSGEQAKLDTVAISRTEVCVTLEEVVQTASYLLNTGGRFYMVHRIDRLSEVLTQCSLAKLEPKVLQILTPDDDKDPHIFLVKCIKEGKKGIVVKRPRKIVAYV